MKPRRTVFYVSDRTGITAEVLGKTLLTQFPEVEFSKRTLPFVDTPEKAAAARDEINAAVKSEALRPIVICTLINDEARATVESVDALCLDLFEGFIGRLEAELGMASSHALGLTHGMGNPSTYERRMAAVTYTLAHDDGISTSNYADADLILVGVSRTGKTPTCLPKSLVPHRARLFGLTITAERLSAIRNERRPGSRYASIETCREEVRAAEGLFQQERLPMLDTTAMSVEEIAITILHRTGLAARPEL